MPELPEVETICRGLRSIVVGQKISKVDLREPRLRSRVNGDFSSQLLDRTILSVERRGKYLLFRLEGGRVWISHLGMSGKLIYVESVRPMEKHDHIIVTLDRNHELRFHDPRRFGLTTVLSEQALVFMPQMMNLGPEPFDHCFNGDYLYSIARNSRRRIRDLLIDQRAVAGLGNIYANEILYRAGIRPTTRSWKLGRTKVRRIAQIVPELLNEAIRWCGTSFSDYRDAEDRFGEFQNHLRVYDREGESCRVCPAEIKRILIGNRSAFYCPRCQK